MFFPVFLIFLPELFRFDRLCFYLEGEKGGGCIQATGNILFLNWVQVHRCSLHYYVNSEFAQRVFYMYISYFVSSKGVCVRGQSQRSVNSATTRERPECMATEKGVPVLTWGWRWVQEKASKLQTKL